MNCKEIEILLNEKYKNYGFSFEVDRKNKVGYEFLIDTGKELIPGTLKNNGKFSILMNRKLEKKLKELWQQ